MHRPRRFVGEHPSGDASSRERSRTARGSGRGAVPLQSRSDDRTVRTARAGDEPDATAVGLGDRRRACSPVLVPRDCPRVAVWPRNATERARFEDAFCTAAERLQAIELRWLPTLASTELHRSRFDPSSFRPWAEANGQWISDIVVEPSAVDRLDDLIGLHVSAGIELRAAPNLRPLRDLAVSGGWDFGVVRFQLAAPR
jgi:hypothetical protein